MDFFGSPPSPQIIAGAEWVELFSSIKYLHRVIGLRCETAHIMKQKLYSLHFSISYIFHLFWTADRRGAGISCWERSDSDGLIISS